METPTLSRGDRVTLGCSTLAKDIDEVEMAHHVVGRTDDLLINDDWEA